MMGQQTFTTTHHQKGETIGKLFFTMKGRADIKGSKSKFAINAWLWDCEV